MGVKDDPHFYDEEIAVLEQKIKFVSERTDLLGFYGSSSVRLWQDIQPDLEPLQVLNLGFGGSSFEWCIFHFERLFSKFSPKELIVYAGDNDLGNGLSVDELMEGFHTLTSMIRQRFPDIPLHFISIKPSVSRDYLIPSIKSANQQMKSYVETQENMGFINVYDAMLEKGHNPNTSYYTSDLLHMNRRGYLVWKKVLRTYFGLE